jgi:hypothetical protein
MSWLWKRFTCPMILHVQHCIFQMNHVCFPNVHDSYVDIHNRQIFGYQLDHWYTEIMRTENFVDVSNRKRNFLEGNFLQINNTLYMHFVIIFTILFEMILEYNEIFTARMLLWNDDFITSDCWSTFSRSWPTSLTVVSHCDTTYSMICSLWLKKTYCILQTISIRLIEFTIQSKSMRKCIVNISSRILLILEFNVEHDNPLYRLHSILNIERVTLPFELLYGCVYHYCHELTEEQLI